MLFTGALASKTRICLKSTRCWGKGRNWVQTPGHWPNTLAHKEPKVESQHSRESWHRRALLSKSSRWGPAFVLHLRCPGEPRPEKETVQMQALVPNTKDRIQGLHMLGKCSTCEPCHSPGNVFISRHISAGSFSHTNFSLNTTLPLQDPYTQRMKIPSPGLVCFVQKWVSVLPLYHLNLCHLYLFHSKTENTSGNFQE